MCVCLAIIAILYSHKCISTACQKQAFIRRGVSSCFCTSGDLYGRPVALLLLPHNKVNFFP
jgi:hypothetical protein